MLFTDDEIMAFAAFEQRAWLAALPSVALDDAESVASAVFRGMRSLLVRDLADPAERTVASSAGDAVRLVRGTTVVRAGVVDDGPVIIPTGAGLIVVRDDDGPITDLVRPDGTHDITAVSDDDAGWAVTNLMRSVFDAGLDDERRLLVRFVDVEAPTLLISLGVVAFGSVQDTADGTRFAPTRTSTDVEGSIAALGDVLSTARTV